MSQLVVHVGEFSFEARFEERLAPKTCAAFRRAMPFESQAIHVRWSGEVVRSSLATVAPSSAMTSAWIFHSSPLGPDDFSG